MSIGRFSVSNPVLINILMVLILVLGAFSVSRLPREQFAEVPFYWVLISVPYPGVAAEDVERTVTVPIESEMDGLDKLKEIGSVTSEGVSLVRVQFDDGISQEEFSRLFQDVQTRFSKVSLPDGTLDALIDDFSSADFLPVVEVTLSGDIGPEALNRAAIDLRERLLSLNEVAGVEELGVRDRQIRIRADQDRLEALGVSVDEIVRAVQTRSVTIPGGTLQTPSREYLLRTVGDIDAVREFGTVVVRRSRGGGDGAVRIADIAEVKDMLDPDGIRSRFNGENSITLRITKVPGGNSVAVVARAKDEIAAFQETAREGLSISLFNDTSQLINASIGTLVTNALIGFVLLVVILYLFLGLRNALITALGIPMTFAITFVAMEGVGESLNSNSLFALVLVLGMIVDHAIVIIENSYRLKYKGLDNREAAVLGTDQVVVPVVAATLTTIAAFLPLMILPGLIGRFFRVIPLVVCIALVASTAEAIVFLPVHFAEWAGDLKKRQALFFAGIESWFGRVLPKIYRRRKLVVTVSGVAMVGVFALTPLIKQDLFKGEDYTYFYVDIELPTGAPRDKTDQIIAQFEERLLPLVGNGEVVSVRSTIGLSTFRNQTRQANNAGQIVVDLAERREGRERPIDEVLRDVQTACRDIAGVENVQYRVVRGGPPVDPPVSLRFFGDDYDELAGIAADVKRRLREYPELYNIADNLEAGTPEMRIDVNHDRASELGLSVAAVGSHVRAAFDGVVATTFFDDNEEIDVRVSFGDRDIASVSELTQLKIPTPDGRLIPFSSVCTARETRSIAAIKRVDGRREVTVTAEAYDKSGIRDINAEFETLFRDTYQGAHPGVVFKVGGEFAEFANILVQILRLFLVGLFLIYLVLGTQFKSYSQPLLILVTVPFAFVGIIAFLVLSGTPFSTTVLYAGVALAGIAVNDSIVLISFVNDLRREGRSVAEAVVEGARVRLRPIVLTSLTTIGGLVPTAIGLGGWSPVWGPMASTISFGLAVSTITALVIIPCLYGVLEDVKGRGRRDATAEGTA